MPHDYNRGMTERRTTALDKDTVAAAHRLYFAGQHSEAGALCGQILDHDSDQFDALYLSGLVAYRSGDQRIADRLIEQACRVRPEIIHFDDMTALLRQRGMETWLSVREERLKQFYIFANNQGFIISHPKCGRTWVRLMLGRYLLRGRDGNPLNISLITRDDPDLPSIRTGHDDHPQLKPHTDVTEDKSIYRDKLVVFLVRDPRDVLVSVYFQYTKRGGKERANDAAFRGSLSDYIRHRIGGLFSLVRFYNAWARNRDVPRGFHLIRYEGLSANTHGELARLIEFFGLPNLGPDAIDDAVSFSSFDNMRRLEETNALDHLALQPPRDGDPEGFKVRRGVVGGYWDYLSDDDIAFVDDYLGKELDDLYADYKKPSRD